MSKAIRTSLLICSLLLLGLLALTACGHTHKFGEWKTVREATCLLEGLEERTCSCGEKESNALPMLAHVEETLSATEPTCDTVGKTEGVECSVCKTAIVEQQIIPILGHTFDLENHVCETCHVTLHSIATRNDFMAYEGKTDALILLDKCVDISNPSEHRTLTIAPDAQHIRLVGTAGARYNISFEIDPAHEKDVTIDLINVTLTSTEKAPLIRATGTHQVSVCFYGTSCGIIARTGDAGTNAGILSNFSMNGEKGGNGELAIQSGGAVRLLVAAESVEIKGGDGGRGGYGMDAAPSPQGGGDGGNGGNGAQAIEASSIDVYAAEGFEAKSIVLAGGLGGQGGEGGDKFLIGKDGANGANGTSATATNISPTYH